MLPLLLDWLPVVCCCCVLLLLLLPKLLLALAPPLLLLPLPLLAPLALLALPALLEPPALLELLQELLLLPPLLLLACHGCPCKWNSRSRCDEQIAALVEGGPSCTAPPPCSPALLRERQGRPQLGGDLLDVLWRGQHDVACERLRG